MLELAGYEIDENKVDELYCVYFPDGGGQFELLCALRQILLASNKGGVELSLDDSPESAFLRNMLLFMSHSGLISVVSARSIECQFSPVLYVLGEKIKTLSITDLF